MSNTKPTSKFTFPKRYDPKEALDGIWFDITDEAGNAWGSYKLSIFDATIPQVKAKIESCARKNKGIKSEKAMVKALVEVSLHDWKNMGPLFGGKDVPFDKDVAFELLTNEEASFLADAIFKNATDILNFQGDPVADKEEDLKNNRVCGLGMEWRFATSIGLSS